MPTHKFDTYILDFLAHSLNTKGFELIPLAGDASARQYARVLHGSDSFVLMIWEPYVEDGSYPFTSVLNHFHKHNVHVPKIYDSSPEKGLLLLEDLGDLTLERKFWETQNQEHVLPFYEQAIDELIKIHYPCTEDHSPCTAFDINFDTEKLLWEMNYGQKHLFQDLCKLNLKSRELATLNHVFTNICKVLAQQPKRICHRDYHSRNLMIKLGNMRVIDFQDARLGPIQYDLVSLLHDSYVQLNDSVSDKILNYYINLANESTVKNTTEKIHTDEFHSIFQLQLIQRCFKACGSFASFYNLRKDTRYLNYISRTINKVANSLLDFPEHQEFRNIIIDHGLLERKFESL